MNNLLLSDSVPKQRTVQVTPPKHLLKSSFIALKTVDHALAPIATAGTLRLQRQCLRAIEKTLAPNEFARSLHNYSPKTDVQQRMCDRVHQIEAARQKVAEALKILQDLI